MAFGIDGVEVSIMPSFRVYSIIKYDLTPLDLLNVAAVDTPFAIDIMGTDRIIHNLQHLQSSVSCAIVTGSTSITRIIRAATWISLG